jgi:hypothetical protein
MDFLRSSNCCFVRVVRSTLRSMGEDIFVGGSFFVDWRINGLEVLIISL